MVFPAISFAVIVPPAISFAEIEPAIILFAPIVPAVITSPERAVGKYAQLPLSLRNEA